MNERWVAFFRMLATWEAVDPVGARAWRLAAAAEMQATLDAVRRHLCVALLLVMVTKIPRLEAET